jgi:hypothetical protein
MTGGGYSQSKPCRTPVEHREKLLAGMRPAARAATPVCDESDNHSRRSSRSAGRKNVALAYRHLISHGEGHAAAEHPNRLRAPGHRLIPGAPTPRSPHALSQADAPFFHLAPARPASSDGLCERLSDSCSDPAQLALWAVKRSMLAGPHPRSRSSSTSLVAAAAGATGPESDFSGRCDRDCGANALRSN